METIRHRGYIKYSPCKEYFELDEEGKYIFKVYADHLYIKETEVDTYLKDGTFYKTVTEEDRFNKVCTEIVEEQYGVVQIDFDFYLMPVGNFGTIPEICSLTTKLNNSFDREFKTEFTNDMKETDYTYTKMSKPIEINKLGCTRQVQSVSNDFISNFDMIGYKKRKEAFIKELDCKHLKGQCEAIYYYNVQNLKSFFMCNERGLFSKNFNLFNRTLDRLNYNINQKQKLRL